MDNRSARNYTRLAMAIVVAAVILGAAIVVSTMSPHATVTSTSTINSTTTSITTQTLAQTISLTQTVTSTSTSTSTLTITSTTTSTSTYYPFVAPQLHVQLNATTIRSGGAVKALITLTNLLPYNLSIAPSYPTIDQLLSNSSIANWNAHDFICGGGGRGSPVWSLAGYGVFKGHYSSANLSSAGGPLFMIPPLVISCAAEANPDKIVLLPSGSRTVAYYPKTSYANATVVEGQTVMNATTMTCVGTTTGIICDGRMSLFGYWNWTGESFYLWNSQDANTSSKYFSYFPPGQYTLVTEDIWGATIYSYFQVVLFVVIP